MVFILHLKRIYRILGEIGLLRTIFLLSICAALCWGLIKTITFYPSKLIPFLSLVLFITSLHFGRKDKRFIRLAGTNRARLFLIQYLSILSPFIIANIFANSFFYALALFIFPFFIAPVNFTIQPVKWNTLNLNIVPPNAFEWKSGIRKNVFLLLMVYLGILFFSVHYITLVAGVIIQALVVTTFYYECEPPFILLAGKRSAGKFLANKVKESLSIFLIYISPFILLALIFHIQYLVFIFTAVIVACILIGFAIALKYALYLPGANLKNNAIIMAFITVCFFFPFLMPLPLIFLIVYYRKAVKNLKNILYAYH